MLEERCRKHPIGTAPATQHWLRICGILYIPHQRRDPSLAALQPAPQTNPKQEEPTIKSKPAMSTKRDPPHSDPSATPDLVTSHHLVSDLPIRNTSTPSPRRALFARFPRVLMRRRISPTEGGDPNPTARARLVDYVLARHLLLDLVGCFCRGCGNSH